jgi:GNAT superfamily N-acetyltransferase
MKIEITIRKAQPDEISWINTQYDQVGFKRSKYDNEFIAIAEVNGRRAALGRLQYVVENEAELGGMYVREEFRGYGLASKIVEFLINNSESYNKVYCLPFSHLESFYKKFCLCVVTNKENIPSSVIDKHYWCNSTYEGETLLFVLNKE